MSGYLLGEWKIRCASGLDVTDFSQRPLCYGTGYQPVSFREGRCLRVLT